MYNMFSRAPSRRAAAFAALVALTGATDSALARTRRPATAETPAIIAAVQSIFAAPQQAAPRHRAPRAAARPRHREAAPVARSAVPAPVTDAAPALPPAANPAPLAEKPAPRASGASGTGVASFYGGGHHGGPTASGERFNMHAMTAAHRTAPLGSKLLVTNLSNGKSVVVRVNDRGPYINGRIIDVSQGAAQALGFISAGITRVRIEPAG